MLLNMSAPARALPMVLGSRSCRMPYAVMPSTTETSGPAAAIPASCRGEVDAFSISETPPRK
jgi:hypothetical protein